MKKGKVKPNLAGILLMVLGVIIIVLAILFFAVEPAKNNQSINFEQQIAI